MGFQCFGGQVCVVDSGLNGHDLAANDGPRVDPSEEHADEIEYTYFGPCHHRLDPEPKVPREHREKNQNNDKSQCGQYDANDEYDLIHGSAAGCQTKE
jgi:hypothetical protein